MKDVNRKINQKSNERRKWIVLKTIVSSLAVLGSAGTIVFGTLWCHSRKSPTPEIDEIDVVLNQATRWDYGDYRYCTMHSNQVVEVKPNTRYNITIDMTKHEISTYQSLSFYFQFGDAVESDTPLVDLSNDFIFNAIDIDKNSWPMCGKLVEVEHFHFKQISFENTDDFDYIIYSNTIVGHLTTANFIDSIDPCYLTFSSIYW